MYEWQKISGQSWQFHWFNTSRGINKERRTRQCKTCHSQSKLTTYFVFIAALLVLHDLILLSWSCPSLCSPLNHNKFSPSTQFSDTQTSLRCMYMKYSVWAQTSPLSWSCHLAGGETFKEALCFYHSRPKNNVIRTRVWIWKEITQTEEDRKTSEGEEWRRNIRLVCKLQNKNALHFQSSHDMPAKYPFFLLSWSCPFITGVSGGRWRKQKDERGERELGFSPKAKQKGKGEIESFIQWLNPLDALSKSHDWDSFPFLPQNTNFNRRNITVAEWRYF